MTFTAEGGGSGEATDGTTATQVQLGITGQGAGRRPTITINDYIYIVAFTKFSDVYFKAGAIGHSDGADFVGLAIGAGAVGGPALERFRHRRRECLPSQ